MNLSLINDIHQWVDTNIFGLAIFFFVFLWLIGESNSNSRIAKIERELSALRRTFHGDGK